MAHENLFKWRQHEPQIILLCVRWSLRYSLSQRHLEAMMVARGLHVDPTTIDRWVPRYAPALEKRVRAPLKQTNDPWRVDDTQIKVRGTWMYLYRAIDSAGSTLDFVLSPQRDTRSAAYFFRNLLGEAHTVVPRVVTVDQHAAYPPAFQTLQEAGGLTPECDLRPVKYLNNIVAQDQRFIKRRVRSGGGFSWFRTAWATIQGDEATNQLRKGQGQGTSKGDIGRQNRFIERAFGLAAGTVACQPRCARNLSEPEYPHFLQQNPVGHETLSLNIGSR